MISLSAVSYRYPHTGEFALTDLSLSVEKGRCVMITGPSGAGKTTLCLASAGVLAHEYGGKKEGTIEINGLNVNDYRDLSEIATNLGIVFDDPDAQLIFTTVEEEILSALERRGLEAGEIEDRLKIIMDRTRLTLLKDRAPHTLSGGQKQRLVLATTLALGTDILVLDEPTSELDDHGTRGIFEILKNLKAEGKTIILVEHKFGYARELADTVIVLEKGRISKSGPPDEIIRDNAVREILLPDFAGIRDKKMVHPPGSGDHRPVIVAEGLSHRYGDIHALSDVDLVVEKGEFIAIVGENGSGKTTLIKHFNGLLRPTAGSLNVGGKDAGITPITELARDVGLVFQNPDHMFFADTVSQEVGFGVDNLGIPDRDAVIDHALTRVRLLHAKNLYPKWLSRGERQRLAIACVIAMQPAVIVLDEPTTGLDGKEAREIMEVLKELQIAGHTIVMVTHSSEIARECADRVIRMEQGRIVSDVKTRAD
ncbi:MAG TPA: energy-coupling factor transporter ATPase [Methanoregulaceae archaeon]|nr:energy-coupling factor transporter ATPase [Methanoregulaceae archaeon]